MIPPRNNWIAFTNTDEKLKFMTAHSLASKTASYPKALTYCGHYTEKAAPCTLVGYVGKNVSVIQIGEELHCINTDYLAEMQSGFMSFSAPEQYIVLDFETTGKNHKLDSIIEIGAVKYERGSETATFETLVNPLRPIPWDIVKLTGISDQAVEAAPLLNDILPQFVDFLGDLPIVAHNASFEKSFLTDIYNSLGLEFKNPIIDTLKTARKAFPSLENHKLKTLKSVLSLREDIDISHRALSDVYVTAELYRVCTEKLRNIKLSDTGNESVQHDCSADEASSRNLPKSNTKQRRKPNKKPSEFTTTVDEIDKNNPLNGKSVVFTGSHELEREELMQIVVNCGAIIKSAVSRKTDYLIVGNDGVHSKERFARELNEKGEANIKVLTVEALLEIAKTEVSV